MFLSASPQEEFRAAEIAAQNAAPQPASPPSPKLPRLLLAGVGVFLLYSLMLKGKK